MTNALKDYAEHIEATFTPEMFLGRILWFCVPETFEISHPVFCKTILDSGIGGEDDDVVLPNVPRSVDIFKRACKAAERIRVQKANGDGHYNFLIRDAGKNSEKVFKELVVEVLDAEEHVLSYATIGKFTYIRSNETVNLLLETNSVNYEIKSVATEIVQDIKNYYDNKKNTLIGYPAREFIRRVIEKNYKGILARPSGGVYFVTSEYDSNIVALENVVNSFGGGCNMFTFPVVNDGKMREMVRIAFEEESCNDADKLLAQMADIIKSGKKISVDRYTEFKVQYNFLREKVVSYSDVLETAMEQTASRLELMSDILFDIVDNVKV
jgi:hypothetical protein